MNRAVERILAVATKEVGYLEKRTNAQLDSPTANAGSNNWTKFARDLDALGFYNGKKSGYAWCDVFVDWCMVTAFGVETALALLCQPMGSAGAGCTSSANYYKAKGRFFKTGPQPGDQIFFTKDGGKSMNHTGLVVEVKDGKVYTIEGNTSGASGVIANGGGVCRKSYAVGYAKIGGYGRPDWSLVPEEKAAEPTPAVYNTVAECPQWAQTAVQWAVKSGYIQGDEQGRLGLDATKLWALQVMYNIVGRGK